MNKLERRFCYEIAKEIGDYEEYVEKEYIYDNEGDIIDSYKDVKKDVIDEEFEYWLHRMISQNVSKKGYEFLSYLLDKRGFDLDEQMLYFFRWVDKDDYDGYVQENFSKFKNKIEILDFYGVDKTE